MSNPDAPGTVQNNNQTLNDRTGLYIAIIALAIAGISLGMQINAPRVMDAKIESLRAEIETYKDKATVSENHWRNLEVKQGVMEEKLNGRR